MQRYKIVHRTYYNFSANVQLGLHFLRLRPKENHELRIESSSLLIRPEPVSLRWHRDVEDNSVAIVSFDTATQQLAIESQAVIQQYNLDPLDFVLEDYAINYPFNYKAADSVLLAPYRKCSTNTRMLEAWLSQVKQPNEQLQTYTLLARINRHIHQSLAYQVREEQGVQTAQKTLTKGSGSCRDFACLFMEIARYLGLAARFVSGYLYTLPPASTTDFGATHAWIEVYLPGAGWKGFDPTLGEIVGTSHFAVAVARLPESVSPIAGSFAGVAESELDVGVWVSELS